MPHRTLDSLPLDWVRAFEAAARTGSFTAAAAETGLTQAAISQRIGNLEARIGSRLFLRQPRGVSLTVEGEAWLPHVTRALTILRQSTEDLFSTERRKVTIEASPSVVQHWLIPRLAGAAHADRLQISFATMILATDFARGETTVQVRHGTGGWPDRRARPLFAERLGPVVQPDLAAEADWRELPRVALSGPRPGWQDWERQVGGAPGPVAHLRFDTMAAAIAAAAAGLGVALASLPLCRAERAAGSLARLSEEALCPTARYWLTAPEGMMSEAQWERLAGIFCDPAPPAG